MEWPQGGDEAEVGEESAGCGDAGDMDADVFERQAQNCRGVAGELRQFGEEEAAVVGQTDRSRMQHSIAGETVWCGEPKGCVEICGQKAAKMYIYL